MNSLKLKIAVICAVAVAALGMAFVQQKTIKELRQENEELKQLAAQLAPLQEQLARATQEATNTGGGAAAQEGQTRELLRLRNEVSQLREATNKLTKARQESQTLAQRMASEAEASRGAVAQAQAEAQAAAQKSQNVNVCINNLRMIDAAKQQWALQNGKQATDTPTMEDLRPYLGRGPNGVLPVCPDGGVYTLGAVSEKPTCTIPGHALP